MSEPSDTLQGVADESGLESLRSILNSVSWAVGKTIQANGGFDPRPGSKAAQDIAEQEPFVARSKTPVLDAYSVALMRLSSAAEHFEALARLIEAAALAYGPASLARTALENSARAWWALDPAIDVKTRIARGRTDVLANLNEVIRLLDAIEPDAIDEQHAGYEEVRGQDTPYSDGDRR